MSLGSSMSSGSAALPRRHRLSTTQYCPIAWWEYNSPGDSICFDDWIALFVFHILFVVVVNM
ncbi:MAG: hypothetical protein GDA56_02640 [Hormoscilla sp. GM7CHS1pb]|nr:hypothetical protein [Hormoscilla sp. GM7CHS1pb]